MRIAIVEDEAPQRAQVRAGVEAYAAQKGVEIAVSEYPCGDALLRGYAPGFDLIFLDIDMPGRSGMECARVIRESDRRVMIAFCTNLVSCALDGYAVQALDFLVKPVSASRIGQTLDKARYFLRERAPRTISLHTQEGLVNVRDCDILYAETYGRKLRVHTASQVLELRMSIAAMEQELGQEAFFRVHNAYLVALGHVSRLDGLTLTVGGDEVPVSRHKKRAFVKALTTYLGEQL